MSESIYIVSSHYKEDLAWLEDFYLPVVVISKEGGNYKSLSHEKYFNVHLVPNKIRESGSYLWFIVNYWNHLPERMFFIHGHETAYHQVVSLRDAIKLYSDVRGYRDFNDYQRINFAVDEKQSFFCYLWDVLYDGALGKVPEYVEFDRGAQFVVDKSTIKSRSHSFYRRIYDKSLEISSWNKEIDYKLGVFFEATWQFILK